MGVKFKNYSPQVKAQLLKNIVDALNAVGLFVAGEASRNAPVDLGALRNSYSHDIDAKDARVRIGSKEKYAIYVEKGTGIYAEDGNGRKTPWIYIDRNGVGHRTSGQRPQPHLTPAGEDNIDTIIRIIANNLKKGL